MRLLVISDSHNRGDIVDRIIRREKDARNIFFLGDLTADIEDLTYEYTDRVFHIVSGNCDYYSSYSASDIACVGDIKVLFTHGHTLGVKSSTAHIATAARNAGCKIALYGHTHCPDIKYEDGLYIVNPGSCARSRNGSNSYAVIDIRENGILPAIIHI